MSLVLSRGVWVDESTIQEPTSTKSYQDILYSVKNNRLESWEVNSQESFSTNYTVHRAISLIASNVASVPLRFYKSNGDLLPNDNQISKLFNRPNVSTSNFELWEQSIINLLVYGECIWYFNTNDYNRVTEIFVVSPKFMKHYIDKETGQIDRWVFNNKIPMDAKDICFLKLPGLSGVRGMSPIDTILTELQTDKEAAKFNQSYFKNSAQIGGVLYTDKDAEISIEELKKVVTEWNNSHQGSNKAYKVAGLLGGMQYKEITASMKDIQFLDSVKDFRDKIISLLGVNKTVMGISDDVNLANSQMGMRQFIELTVIPHLTRFQQKLNATLFSIFYPEIFCKFDIKSIESLKADFKKQLESAKELLMMGYTRNEINERLDLNMPDTDDNDDLLPMNLVQRGVTNLLHTPVVPEKSVKLEVIEKLPDIENKQSSYRDDYLMSQQSQEIPFHKKMKSYFYKQRSKVLKIMSDAKNVHNITNALGSLIDSENIRLKTALTPLYENVVEAGQNLALKTLNEKMILKELISYDAMYNRLNKIVGINQTTFNQIKMELYEGANEGESIEKMAKRIRGVYNLAEKRSLIIARTETATLISETTFDVYKSKGVKKKQWISTKDSKTRQTHIQNDNDGIIAMNKTFSGTGELFPGEVNCRCCISPIIEL